MLTPEEREFMDLYVREEFLHDYQGYAQTVSRNRGILYDHYAKLWPYYMEAWNLKGGLTDYLPPLPENPTPPCPWASREEFESRLAELASAERMTIG